MSSSIFFPSIFNFVPFLIFTPNQTQPNPAIEPEKKPDQTLHLYYISFTDYTYKKQQQLKYQRPDRNNLKRKKHIPTKVITPKNILQPRVLIKKTCENSKRQPIFLFYFFFISSSFSKHFSYFFFLFSNPTQKTCKTQTTRLPKNASKTLPNFRKRAQTKRKTCQKI